MKRAYICSPLSGDIEGNIKKAIAYAKFVYDRCEMIPIVPHLKALVFDDTEPKQRELGISMSLDELMTTSDIWIFGDDWTSGMEEEIKTADGFSKDRHPVTDEQCEAILRIYG